MATTPLPITTQACEEAWTELKDTLSNLRSYCLQFQSSVTVGSVNSQLVINLASAAGGLNSFIASVKSNATLVAAIVPYIQGQIGNSTFPVAVTVNAIQSAAQILASGISSEFPKDTNGNLLFVTLPASGVPSFASFTGAQFPNTQTNVTNFLATIQ